MNKPIPEAVAWPFSILEAGNWREVYMGTKHMKLEVSYPYEAWERLMAALTAAQQQQGQSAVVDEAMVERACKAALAEVWPDTYEEADDLRAMIRRILTAALAANDTLAAPPAAATR